MRLPILNVETIVLHLVSSILHLFPFTQLEFVGRRKNSATIDEAIPTKEDVISIWTCDAIFQRCRSVQVAAFNVVHTRIFIMNWDNVY